MVSRRAHLPERVRREILLSAACHYCGDPWPTQVDHVQPRAHGGTDARDNLVSACRWCNEEKSDRTPEQWRAERETRGLPWPPDGRVAAVRRSVRAAVLDMRRLPTGALDDLDPGTQRWTLVLVLVCMVLTGAVAVVAFFGSFHAQSEYAVQVGIATPENAWTLPAAIDGAVVVCGLLALGTGLAGIRTRWPAAVSLTALVISVAVNVAHAPPTLAARLTASVMPIALAACGHLVLLTVHLLVSSRSALLMVDVIADRVVQQLSVNELPAPIEVSEPVQVETASDTDLRRLLAEADNNVSEAARRMGVSRATFYRRLRETEPASVLAGSNGHGEVDT